MQTNKFWNKVNKGDKHQCWDWLGAKTAQGYGQLVRGGERLYAHRYSFQLANPSLDSPSVVRHRCDNPTCCNPHHLIEGTRVDNARDMYQRGRASERRGTRGKLTESQAILVLTDSRRIIDIARDLGVTHSCISRIKRGLNWAHLRTK